MTDGFYRVLCLMLFTFITAFFTGWGSAHHEVAIECVRQGGFYVGDRDFDCSVRRIEENK